jgi:Leucine-rich repeat (LRR) protein
MPLTHLECDSNRVAGLTPLSGMKLVRLNIYGTDVADLSPLKGMTTLRGLECSNTRVSDLTSLAGIQLEHLHCAATQLSDLSPLKGMPLTRFHCYGTHVSNLSPLRGMPLAEVGLDMRLFHAADETLLRSLPLKQFYRMPSQQRQPAVEFWKAFKARRAAAETFAAETAKRPVKDQVATVVARLKQLNADKVGPLGSLIENDAIAATTLVLTAATTDVTPLRAFTKLKKLTLTGGPHWLDISAVNSLPLEELTCTADIALRNAPVLRGMKSLRTINGQPAGKYLDSLIAAAKSTP